MARVMKGGIPFQSKCHVKNKMALGVACNYTPISIFML